MQKILVERITSFTGHKDCIYTIQPFQGGVFYSAGGDGMVVEWTVEEPDKGEVFAKLTHSVYALALDFEKQHLWIGENFAGIHVVTLDSKKEVASAAVSKAAIFDIQLFENKAFVATGEGVIIVLDAKDLTTLARIPAAQKSARAIAVNPVTKEFAVGFSDNFIRIFSTETFALKKEFEAHKNSVFTVRFSPDYQYLLSGSRDAHLKIWNGKTYELEKSIVAHMFTINHISFDTSGENFATCSMDKSIKLWRTKDFSLLKVIDKARHAGHGTSINKLAWLNPYKLLACSDDRAISFWQINNL